MSDLGPIVALVAPLALMMGAVWRLSGQVHDATSAAQRLARELSDLRVAVTRLESERVSLPTCEERMRALYQRSRLEAMLAQRGGGVPDSGPQS